MPLAISGATGEEKWVEFPDTAMPSASSYTLLAWARFDSFGGFIIGALNLGSPFNGLSLAVSGSGAPTIWDPNGFAYLASTTQFGSTSTWHLWAVRVSVAGAGGTVAVSLDGAPWETLKTGNTSGFVPSGGSRLQRIGHSNYSNWMNGQVADVRHYSRLLSDAEIALMYAYGPNRDYVLDYNVCYPLFEGSPQHTPGSSLIERAVTQSGTGTAFSVAVPTVAQALNGLGMIAIIAVTGSGGTPPTVTAPSGWTLRNSGQTDLPSTFSTPAVYIYTRDGGSSSEPATYSFPASESASKIGCIIALRDAAGAPLVSPGFSTGTSATPSSPSITPGAEAYGLRVCCTDAETIPANFGDFYPTGRNGRIVRSQTGLGNGLTLAIADLMVGSGATGAATWNPSASEQWGAWTLAWAATRGDRRGPVDMGLAKQNALTFGDARFTQEAA